MNRALASIQRVRFSAFQFVRPSFSRLPVFRSTSIVRPPRTFQPKQINHRTFHTSQILKSQNTKLTKTELRIINTATIIAVGPFFGAVFIIGAYIFAWAWLFAISFLMEMCGLGNTKIGQKLRNLVLGEGSNRPD